MRVRCLGRGNARRVHEALQTLIAEDEWSAYFSSFNHSWGLVDPAECAGYLRSAGLTQLEGLLCVDPLVFGSQTEFLHWFACNWSGFVARVPLERRTTFLSQFARMYDGHQSASYRVELVWLQLSAVKRNPPPLAAAPQGDAGWAPKCGA